MKKLYFVTLLFMLFTSFIIAQNADFSGNKPVAHQQFSISDVLTTLAWTDLAPSVNAVSRSACAFIVIGGNPYIFQFGGGSGAQYTAVARYDVNANTWTNTGFAPIPSSMSAATAVTIGDKIYLFGGENSAGLGKTYMYDPSANTWTAKASMLTAVTDAVVLKYDNNYVYVIAGGNGLFGTTIMNTVQLYNVSTDTYSACTNYPISVGMAGGGLLGNTMIVASGWNGTTGTASAYKGTIAPPNMTDITWTPIGDYPGGGTTRMASAPIILSTTYPTAAGIFFTGGALNGSTLTGNTYLYNICTDAWETLTPSLPLPRSNMKACTDGLNCAFVVAGYTTAGVGNTTKGTLTAIAGNCFSLVPVELTSFTAAASGSSVTLKWNTATEINNRGFEIQRQVGEDFQTIGFLSGNGTTTLPKSYTYTENNLPVGNYTYRLKQIDFNGTFEYTKTVSADISAPMVFSLDQNYPNPFNPTTKINFSLATDSKVTLKVFNVLGQLLEVIAEGNISAGNYSHIFNAANYNSGIYFYQLEAQGNDGSSFKSVKKMMLTK